MNLEELKARVDFLYKQSRNPKEDIVYITTSEHSIGGRAKCGVKSVSLDFDLENPYEFWEYLMQPTVEREPNETDEHYKERLLKYMEDNQ